MRKKLSFMLIIVAAVIYYLMWSPFSPLNRGVFYVAVAGPMDNPKGIAMKKGVELYKDIINHQGGINGRKMELIYFDDKDDPETAQNVALKIADDNKASVVIGHFKNSTSVAAGKVYKQNEIPVITASATDKSVIAENEWYFRVIPDTEMEAVFIANYIARRFQKDEASIVFSKSIYGKSLARHFEKTAKFLGMKVKNRWEWNLEKDASEKDVAQLIDSIVAADDPGILFLATHSAEGAKIVTALKDRQKTYPIIGSYAFSRSFFIEMKKYPKEWSDPGYYSDGIYFASPYMADVGGAESAEFKKNFLKKYWELPSEVNACYYDAIRTAAEAIKNVGIRGRAHIREDRRRIRTALEGFYSEHNAVRGATGDIYFDETGGVKRHLVVGIWRQQKAVPVFWQYQHIAGTKHDNLVEDALEGNIILAGDVVMKKIRMVFAGIDNIRINSIDSRQMVCNLEFDLMFTYSGHFDDAAIEFTNAVGSVQLGNPIEEKIKNDITSRKYRLKGNFKFDADFFKYPLDTQKIPIRFRHISQMSDNMMYVPDTLDYSDRVVGNLDGWDTLVAFFYQNISEKVSTLGNPAFFDSPRRISYSRFNAEIMLQRSSPILVYNYIIIIIFMICILIYTVWFIPPNRFRTRIFISSLIFLSCTAGSSIISWATVYSAYLTIVDICFIVVLTLAAWTIFSSVLSYKKYVGDT